MLQGQLVEGSTVVAFRPMPRRIVRDRMEATERGTLLLFTGVRYERIGDTALADASADDADEADGI